jgi:rifampin ADP-ribosyltransferase
VTLDPYDSGDYCPRCGWPSGAGHECPVATVEDTRADIDGRCSSCGGAVVHSVGCRSTKSVPPPGTWYHGGPAGLVPGDLLEPGHTSAHNATMHGLAPARWREAVYITTRLSVAKDFAQHYAQTLRRDGAVYVVEPLGDLAPDPQGRALVGRSMRCPYARIIAVQLTVPMIDNADAWARARRVAARYAAGQPNVRRRLGLNPDEKA